jgi:hypothetical protein
MTNLVFVGLLQITQLFQPGPTVQITLFIEVVVAVVVVCLLRLNGVLEAQGEVGAETLVTQAVLAGQAVQVAPQTQTHLIAYQSLRDLHTQLR